MGAGRQWGSPSSGLRHQLILRKNLCSMTSLWRRWALPPSLGRDGHEHPLPGAAGSWDGLSVWALITSNDSTFNIPGHSTTSTEEGSGAQGENPCAQGQNRDSNLARDGDAS